MRDATRYENEQFENEVLRVARALWPAAEYSGAVVAQGRETDGIFVTEDCIHIIEATTSRRKDKAKTDIDKLARLITLHRKQTSVHAIRGWFITRDEPTADQRAILTRYRNDIAALSFSQFQARLIDSKEYLSLRNNYPFGSVRDPATGKHDPAIQYVPLDLINTKTKDIFPRDQLLPRISEGYQTVILGDYGAGKSMTLRSIYYDLRSSYFKGTTSKFPVYLNLRDHSGQDDAAEIIARHARSIGFGTPHHLVRAWRAGYVHLLIDGFDEVSTLTIQGPWSNLRDNRFRAMEPVRRLIRDHPTGSGLIVAGRAHFFDHLHELRISLGLSDQAVELSLNEFTDAQITTYLKRAGLSGSIPPWLPSRPLLVGYLAAKGLLQDILSGEEINHSMSPALGWDNLLDNISAREAEIEVGVDGGTIRKILERLATKTRASQVVLGSLTSDLLVKSFREICGYSPDARGLVILQRLPGLGVDSEDENSRSFVDESFADACKAGDVIEFVNDPFNFPGEALQDIETSIGNLGVAVAASRAKSRGFSVGKFDAALKVSSDNGSQYMASDVARVVMERGFDIQRDLSFDGLMIPDLEIGYSQSDASRIEYRNCFFQRLDCGTADQEDRMPSFSECFVDEFEGRVSAEDLPKDKFDDSCHIERFNTAAETTAQVLRLEIPMGTRVCVTVLKKLYEQSGAGRRENALYRGLDGRTRRLVPKVLNILQAEGFVLRDTSRNNVIWRPARSHRERAARIIAAPIAADDPVLEKCGSVSG